ncbi:MAG TPA: pyridoxamine 5'-phosphate oxidase family protein [Burkholderiales bacterium]|nr:pyridoxamine 5'-phosphate oxidase family protein [Burkholderiales bacterium]
MNAAIQRQILTLLARNDLLRLATIRADGWPQATTVTYANDGLTLYVMCSKTAQKARNIRNNPKVSLTVDREYKDWNRIKGLSMAAYAEIVRERDEIAHAVALLGRKFKEVAAMDEADLKEISLIKITPQVVSVLDYTKGFGHTDLVRLPRRRPTPARTARR